MTKGEIFLALLDDFARSARRLKLAQGGLEGFRAGAAVFIVALWLLRAYYPEDALWLAAGLVSVTVFGFLGRAALTFPHLCVVARACDGSLRGRESVVTALHCVQRPEAAFSSLVIDDGLALLEAAQPSEVFPFPCFSKFLPILTMWVFVGLLSLFSPLVPPVSPGAGAIRIPADVARREAKALARAASRLEFNSSGRRSMKTLAELLRREAARLDAGKNGLGPLRDKSLSRLTRIGGKVERMAAGLGRPARAAGKALDRLSASAATKELAAAMARADWDGASREASRLGQGKDEEARGAVEALRGAGEAMQEYQNTFVDDEAGADERRALDEAFFELQKELEKLTADQRERIQQTAKAMGKVMREIHYTQLDAAALERLIEALRQGRCGVGCGGEGQPMGLRVPGGKGTGKGKGEGKGKGKGEGQGGPGQSVAPEDRIDVTALRGGLPIDKRARAQTIIEKIRMAPRVGGGHEDPVLTGAVGSYRKEADRVLSRRSVPTEYRTIVGDYFDGLSGER